MNKTDELDNASDNELRAIVFMLTSLRVSVNLPRVQILQFLRYNKTAGEALAESSASNIANELRGELMSFVRENWNELSLACDGNCLLHTDAVVSACYEEFLRDTSGLVPADHIVQIAGDLGGNSKENT